MRLQTNQQKLSTYDIVNILSAQEPDYRRKVRLKKYFNGEHTILGKRPRENTEVNNRLVSNFCSYITAMSTGYFLGQPVTYKTTSEHEHELNQLLEIFKYNDESAHNLELAEEASITGESFEFLYVDGDAQIRFATVPSEEVTIICDATLEANILYAIRRYRVYNLDQIGYDDFVDVYDANEIQHFKFSGNKLTPINSEPHYFGEVPIIEFPNNKQRRGDFEDVISLIDAYNMAQSLTLDDLEDFTDAFLVLKGLGGTSPEDARSLRRNKIIVLDDSGGAEWLIKNLNDTYVENVKTRLQRDIHKFSAIPDMSDDNFAGNASGVAISYKLIGLQQVCARKQREFKKALQRRIELISNILRLKNQGGIDFRDVTIQFTANIPQNLLEQAQIVQTLDGLVSDKTLLSLLPFVENPSEELEELAKAHAEDNADFTSEELIGDERQVLAATGERV